MEYIKNFNSMDIIRLFQEYARYGMNFYSQNKKHLDLVICFLSFLVILLGWIDLSIISKLYFLGLIYMTVRTIRYLYDKILISVRDDKLNKLKNLEKLQNNNQDNIDNNIDNKDNKDSNIDNIDNQDNQNNDNQDNQNNDSQIFQGIKALNDTECKKLLNEFTNLSNNWLMYASLILCDYVIFSLDVLISGIIIGSILRIIRFVLYMKYCKQFVQILEPYREVSSSEKIILSDEDAEILSLPVQVKHLINLMSINNIFCHNLFAKANHSLLTSIRDYSSLGVDMLSHFFFQTLKQASKVKLAVGNTKNYLDPIIQKIKLLIKSKPVERKNEISSY